MLSRYQEPVRALTLRALTRPLTLHLTLLPCSSPMLSRHVSRALEASEGDGGVARALPLVLWLLCSRYACRDSLAASLYTSYRFSLLLIALLSTPDTLALCVSLALSCGEVMRWRVHRCGAAWIDEVESGEMRCRDT